MPPLILPPKDAPLTVGQQRRNQRQFQVISDYFTGLCACSVIAAHVYCGYSLGNAISGSRIGGAVGGGLMLAAWILFLGKIS